MSKSFDSTYISVGNYQQSIAIFMEKSNIKNLRYLTLRYVRISFPIGVLCNARCRDNITCNWMSKSFDSTYISVRNYQQSAKFSDNLRAEVGNSAMGQERSRFLPGPASVLVWSSRFQNG